MRCLLKSVFVLFLLSLNFQLRADNDKFFSYYKLLAKKYQKENKNIGALCENIVFEEVSKKYDPQDFLIVKNLTYIGDKYSGEIDLLVQNKISGMVELVIEVKCKKDVVKAARQANWQLQRFKNTVETTKKVINQRLNFF